MLKWSSFHLSVTLAIVYAALGMFYLIPGVYHPFSSDTINETHAHLTLAAIALVLALVAIVAGRFARPAEE